MYYLDIFGNVYYDFVFFCRYLIQENEMFQTIGDLQPMAKKLKTTLRVKEK